MVLALVTALLAASLMLLVAMLTVTRTVWNVRDDHPYHRTHPHHLDHT